MKSKFELAVNGVGFWSAAVIVFAIAVGASIWVAWQILGWLVGR